VQKARVEDDVLALEIFAGDKRFVVVRPGAVAIGSMRPDGTQSEGGERTPPAVQGLVRKELVPSILSAVDADDARGLLFLRFARKDAPARVLVVECDARAPRWLLLAVTDDGERILATVPAQRADDGRDLRRGRRYEPPRRAPAPRAPHTSPPSSTHPDAPAAPEMAATQALRGAVRVALRSARVRLKAELERLRRLDRALAVDVLRHGDANRLQEEGELLKTVLSTLRRGDGVAHVVGFDGMPRTLALDPMKEPREQLGAWFARARKARAAVAHAAPRQAAVRARLDALVPLSARAQAIADAGEGSDDNAAAAVVAAIDDALAVAPPATAPSARRVAARQGRRRPWRAFRLDGDGDAVVIVRVGRGARDNDALVKAARGNDLWLHARDATGAHVVIPSSGGPVAEGLLRDAALLAAHFSVRRGERHVDVQYTRVKHLKKPGAGAPAGLFLVGHEQVLPLRVDDDRVAALLRREVAADRDGT
jgi:hypothetical protein